MLNDPFSKKIRKHIPWQEYRTLEKKELAETLIDNKYINKERAIFRIQHLELLERELGFVYVGEKQWLKEYLQDQSLDYESWVWKQLNIVFPSCDNPKVPYYKELGIRKVEDEEYGLHWSCYTADISILWMPSVLINNSILCDDAHLIISANGIEVSPPNKSTIFKVLHNYAYYINNLSVNFDKNFILDAELTLLYTMVNEIHYQWRMELCTIGGGYDIFEFVDEEVVKKYYMK